MKQMHPLAVAAAVAPWISSVLFLAVTASAGSGNGCDGISSLAIVAALGNGLGPVLGVAALIALAVRNDKRRGKLLAASGIAFGVLFFVVCVGIVFFCGMGSAMKG
jgi:hypothetical protein